MRDGRGRGPSVTASTTASPMAVLANLQKAGGGGSQREITSALRMEAENSKGGGPLDTLSFIAFLPEGDGRNGHLLFRLHCRHSSAADFAHFQGKETVQQNLLVRDLYPPAACRLRVLPVEGDSPLDTVNFVNFAADRRVRESGLRILRSSHEREDGPIEPSRSRPLLAAALPILALLPVEIDRPMATVNFVNFAARRARSDFLDESRSDGQARRGRNGQMCHLCQLYALPPPSFLIASQPRRRCRDWHGARARRRCSPRARYRKRGRGSGQACGCAGPVCPARGRGAASRSPACSLIAR